MNEINSPESWVGRTETLVDQITATPVAALAATLDDVMLRPASGMPLPPLWHWLYFLPLDAQSALGPDGHARKGGFIPPVPRPRRMWAGSQFRFHAPLRVGDTVRRVSTITDVSDKIGRTGALTFVTVRHELFVSSLTEAAITEFHNIVYRDSPAAGEQPSPTQAAPKSAIWSLEIVPDDVLLFRYSALTFNGHRIHYDRKYATEIEGYPGLVVHGPLIATLLMELTRQNAPERVVTGFKFRAMRPTFDIHPFSVHGVPAVDGGTVRLWAQDHDGLLTMDASATLE